MKEGFLRKAMTSGGIIVLIGCLLAMAFLFVSLATSNMAFADELDDVNAEIDAKVAKLEKIAQRVDKSGAEVAKLEDEISQILSDIEKGQDKRSELQQRIKAISRVMYKSGEQLNIAAILTNAESLSEFMDAMEVRRKVLEEYAMLADEQDRISAELQVSYQTVSKQKDAQVAKLDELHSQQAELDEAVASLRNRADELNAAQQAALAAAAEAEARAQAAAQQANPAPATQDEDDKGKAEADAKEANAGAEGDKAEAAKAEKEAPKAEQAEPEPEPEAQQESSGWQSGAASAYGGSSDDTVGANDPTATGSYVDDYSMGVAVPVSWGPEDYYGRSVEISYNGKTVVATVTDCGGMNGGERSLDLQPGVFRALGADSCDDWGVRDVSYRFL